MYQHISGIIARHQETIALDSVKPLDLAILDFSSRFDGRGSLRGAKIDVQCFNVIVTLQAIWLVDICYIRSHQTRFSLRVLAPKTSRLLTLYLRVDDTLTHSATSNKQDLATKTGFKFVFNTLIP